MRLSYRNEYSDYLKHHELVSGSFYTRLRLVHFSTLLLVTIIGVLGFVGTFPHDLLLAFLIAAGVIIYLVRALPYGRNYRRGVTDAIRTQPAKEITLEIREDGFLETMDGIESFCPWRSIESFQVYRDVLFVSLKSGLWATIPSRYLTNPGATLPDVLEILRSHNIPEKH